MPARGSLPVGGSWGAGGNGTGLLVLPDSSLHRSRSPDSLSWPQGLHPTFMGRLLVSALIQSFGEAAGGNKGVSEALGWKSACEHCEARYSQSFAAADLEKAVPG